MGFLDSNFTDADGIRVFHERYRPLPVVTIGRALEGFPAILMDSYEEMREAIVHLIEVHGCRRLAFIRGPENHFYAQERYRAYVETLEAYGLSFNPNLVTMPALWGFASGIKAMHLLLDERKLRPQADFEAVVAANDDLILAALEVMRARNVRVPGNVAIAGFDDTPSGRTSTPPLTSVAVPFYETGYQAAETLLALMEGEQVPDEASVPSKLLIRRSCGCLDSAVIQAAAKPPVRTGPTQHPSESAGPTEIVRMQRARVLSDMLQAVGEEIKVGLALSGEIVCVRNLNANVEVSIDSEYLRRVIINVVNNAIDAMQEKGLVKERHQLTVSTHVEGDRLEIQISDTGCGIPEDVLNKVFEPLFSTKSFGVGLGLPIIKSIMEQHGGGVEISSRTGEGTTVVLWLPISNARDS